MDDYNSKGDNSEAMPPLDMLKLSLLRRRAEVLSAISSYYNRKLHSGAAPPVSEIQSKLLIFYYELEPALSRWLGDETKLNDLFKLVISDKFKELLSAFRLINFELDARKIIRLDTTPTYNSTDIEVENSIKNT